MKKFMKKKRSGQTVVEYILIVVLVAIASIVILSLFSDAIRGKIAGAIGVLNGTPPTEGLTPSVEILQDLDATSTETK